MKEQYAFAAWLRLARAEAMRPPGRTDSSRRSDIDRSVGHLDALLSVLRSDVRTIWLNAA